MYTLFLFGVKIIQNIGKFSDKLLFFGGTYGNLQATETLQRLAKKDGFSPHEIIFTGDSVAYGGQPEETVQLLKKWGIYAISGNVELQIRNEKENCGCNFQKDSSCDYLSGIWYPYTRNQLSDDSIKWFTTLPNFLSFSFGGKKVGVVHGSFSHISKFIFRSTPWKVKQQEFDTTQVDILLSGHSGIPFYHCNNQKLWVNSGATGMPANDGTNRVWYCILRQEKGYISLEHKSFTYDYQQAQQYMKNAHLPREYSHCLKTGLWHSCDILPPKETSHQGIPLTFQKELFDF